jgi:ABC-type nickel/cobalt efflux system permease component RcnA
LDSHVGQKVAVERNFPAMADIALGTAAGLGFILGLRHAFEPDHLAAVSTLATRHHRPLEGARLGMAWALGHTATVACAAVLAVVTGFELPPSFSLAAELAVGIILIGLGLPILLRYARGRWHMHSHAHDGIAHVHLHSHAQDASHGHSHAVPDIRRSFLVGVAHGMAGSAALVVVLISAAQTAGARVAYFAAFGVGTVAGMLTVSFLLALLAGSASRKGVRWAGALHAAAAFASVFAGLGLAIRVADHLIR